MKAGFLDLMPVDQVREQFIRFRAIDRTRVCDLEHACGCILAQDVHANEPLPAFDRSLMDGYAVRATDVFSARETSSVFLEVVGEIKMGQEATIQVGPGQAVNIPTGAMLPPGADSVVMVEHTRTLPDGRIEITRPTSIGQHILHRAEDVVQNALLLEKGNRVTALDIGVLAACGVTQLNVFEQPKVAIISTGDELVCRTDNPQLGQVRDTNSATLTAQVGLALATPVFHGHIVDDFEKLKRATQQAALTSDLVLLSGGSSVGMRDHTAQVLTELSSGPLLVHGIALAPGKPTLLADLQGTPVVGMPGHPVSSFVVFHVLVQDLLFRLAGLQGQRTKTLRTGRLTANVSGALGRETWHRVRVDQPGDELVVTPVPGTSAVYSSLLHSDGLLKVEASCEGLGSGEMVEVEVLR